MPDETKPSFYNQGEQDPREKGRINPVEAAHELGNIQDKNGKYIAALREPELKIQYEMGKTDAEASNIRLMDLLKENYPDAFIEMMDLKGRRLMVIYPQDEIPNFTDDGYFFNGFVYTEKGVATFGEEKMQSIKDFLIDKSLDLTGVTDFLMGPDMDGIVTAKLMHNGAPMDEENFFQLRVRRINLNPDTRRRLRKRILDAQKRVQQLTDRQIPGEENQAENLVSTP